MKSVRVSFWDIDNMGRKVAATHVLYLNHDVWEWNSLYTGLHNQYRKLRDEDFMEANDAALSKMRDKTSEIVDRNRLKIEHRDFIKMEV